MLKYVQSVSYIQNYNDNANIMGVANVAESFPYII